MSILLRPGILVLLTLALALPGTADAAALIEVKKLTASDAEAEDHFGFGVAVSGNTAIVGAYDHHVIADAGSAYIFERDQGGSGNWGEVTKLTAYDAEAEDHFGVAVAISGDTAIVGAYFADAGGLDAGSAYIFERNEGGSGNWGEVTKLTASDAQVDDRFGISVAINGDTIIVGAYLEDGGGSDAGAAYIFERDQGGADNWGEVTKLLASDAEAEDHFGSVVAVSGNTAIVGANNHDAAANNAGAAYIFERDQGGAGNWGEVKKLTASNAQEFDRFGTRLAISGDTTIVGAYGASDFAGATYVFERNQGGPNNWGEVAKLIASDAQINDFFGDAVAISGDTAIVSAIYEDAGGNAAGAAYIFERDQGGAGNWGEVKKLLASDAQVDDRFGTSVAISGDTAIVGAYLEDSRGRYAGAAYVFEGKDPDGPTPVGDVNCDHAVSIADAQLIAQLVVGRISGLPCANNGDVDESGGVTIADAQLIAQLIVGRISTLVLS